MKKQKRRISIEKKLFAGIVIAILVLATLLYFYHNCWTGVYIIDEVPTSFVGVGIIFIISLVILTIFVLGALIFAIHFPSQTESEKQIQKLSKDFVNVQFKDFDNIPLSKFISKDDIFCTAKLDEDGKVIYTFYLKSKIYETKDYELFLKHFDV